MKLTTEKLKKLIKEEIKNLQEADHTTAELVKQGIEDAMANQNKFVKALEDPKTQKALAKIVEKLGLINLNEEDKNIDSKISDISDALQMSAGGAGLFALNAGMMMGATGASLIGATGVGALAGLLFWYIVRPK